MYSRALAGVPAKPAPALCQSTKSSGSTPSRGEGTSYLRHSRLRLSNHGRYARRATLMASSSVSATTMRRETPMNGMSSGARPRASHSAR